MNTLSRKMKLKTQSDNYIFKSTLLLLLILIATKMNFAQVNQDTPSFGKLKVVISGFEK